MTKVLFVDDHPIVLKGCRVILEDLGVTRIFEVEDVDAGYDGFVQHKPDVTVVDLSFDGDDLAGLDLIDRIRRLDGDARILVFSMHNNPAVVSKTLEAGALGYALKDMSSTEFVAGFEKVSRGEPYLSHRLAVQVAMFQARKSSTASYGLTDREEEILQLLGRGNNNEEIALRLGINLKTVTNSCASIRSKLKLSSLADLIRYAIEHAPTRLLINGE